PMSVSALQVAVRDALAGQVRERMPAAAPVETAPEAWDDDAALAALNGERAHVDALRKIFIDELPGTCDDVRDAVQAGDVERQRAALHRLRASCGFVGAARLAATIAGLQAAPDSGQALARFLQAAQDTLSSASATGDA